MRSPETGSPAPEMPPIFPNLEDEPNFLDSEIAKLGEAGEPQIDEDALEREAQIIAAAESAKRRETLEKQGKIETTRTLAQSLAHQTKSAGQRAIAGAKYAGYGAVFAGAGLEYLTRWPRRGVKFALNTADRLLKALQDKLFRPLKPISDFAKKIFTPEAEKKVKKEKFEK